MNKGLQSGQHEEETTDVVAARRIVALRLASRFACLASFALRLASSAVRLAFFSAASFPGD